MRMPARVVSVLVPSILVLGGCASAPPRTENVTALVGVNVVPMDGERVLADQTVVIRGDRIAALGPRASVTVPKDTENVGRIEGVSLRGTWMAKREIDERLARIAAKNGR